MEKDTLYETVFELLILKGRVEALKNIIKNNEYLSAKEIKAILNVETEEN